MRYALLILVLLVTGCAGSRLPRMSAEVKPKLVPYSGADLEDVTADSLWVPHFKIERLASSNTVEVRQTTIAIRKDQRFEVLRHFARIGMATVQSADTRRAIIRFDEPWEGQTLEIGDELQSRIWRPDRPVRVAIHGTIDKEVAGMTRAELETALKDAGAIVDENLVEGTDLAVLGSNLFGDEWYRKARNELRFALIQQKEVGHYFRRPE
jgi:hypothetical protein